jgi:hypothetical protein
MIITVSTLVACLLAVALAGPRAAAAAQTCPAEGFSNTTIRGGLTVADGYCLLADVTVTGGVTVLGGGQVELESSRVAGGVRVRPGGEIEVGTSVFGGEATVTTIRGGLRLDHPVDWDIENARILGGLRIAGGVSPLAAPTLCGNTIAGGLRIRAVQATIAFVGAPGDAILGAGGACEGNVIRGALTILDSGLLHVEGNRVSGAVRIHRSRLT